MKNKRVKQMICDTYGCDYDFWGNLKVYRGTKFNELTQVDAMFFGYHFDLGLLKAVSLTANQLKGMKQ